MTKRRNLFNCLAHQGSEVIVVMFVISIGTKAVHIELQLQENPDCKQSLGQIWVIVGVVGVLTLA